MGATAAEHAGLAAGISRVEVRRLPARPLADVRIPERKLIGARHKGRLTPQRYRSIWLGLDASLAASDEATIGDHEVELTLADATTGARGMLALYDHVPRGRSLDVLFRDVIAAAERATGMQAIARGRQRRRSALGQVIVARYSLGAASLELHVVPLCAETGALVWLAMAPSPAASTWLEQRWSGFRWIVDRRIPACRWLDPK
jgi:hypothetical protein